MATNVATLHAKLSADTSDFQSKMKSASKLFGGFGGLFGGAFKLAMAPLRLIGGLIKGLFSPLAAIGKIAAGIGLARIFEAGVSALSRLASHAIDVTGIMQRLGLQIQTMAAREMQKNINAAIDQSITYRQISGATETLVFDVAKLNAALGDQRQMLLDLNPELREALFSGRQYAIVQADIAKKWLGTSDVFEAAAPRARELQLQLQEIALISPYTIATTNTMFRLGTSLGFTTDQSLVMTKGMLDVAAGLGLTNEQSQRLVLNFAQIRSQGKMTQRDIREMSLTGFQMADVFDEMNRTLGLNIKTNKDFNAALASNKFTWEEFINAFASMAEREFGESARRMAFTIDGIKSTFQDVFYTVIPAILGPAAEEFGKFAEEGVEGLLGIVESGVLDEIGEKVAEWTRNAIADIKEWVGWGKVFVGAFKEAGGGIDGLLAGFQAIGDEQESTEAQQKWYGLGDTIAGLITKIGNFKEIVTGFKDFGGTLFGQIVDAFKGIEGAELPSIAEFIPDIDPGAAGVIDAIAQALVGIGSWWSENGPAVLQGIEDLFLIFSTFAQSAGGEFAVSIGGLKDTLVALWTEPEYEALRTTIGTIAGAIGVMAVMGVAAISTLIKTLDALIQIFGRVAQGMGIWASEIGSGLESLTQGDVAGMVSSLTRGAMGLDLAAGGIEMLVTDLPKAAWDDWIGGSQAMLDDMRTVMDEVGTLFSDPAPIPPPKAPPLPYMEPGSTHAFWQQAIVPTEGNLESILAEAAAAWDTEQTAIALQGIGARIPQGIAEGIDQQSGVVRQAAADLAAQIEQTLRDELGIHSPSAVMFDLGEMTSTGFTSGLDEGFTFDYNTYMAGVYDQIAAQQTPTSPSTSLASTAIAASSQAAASSAQATQAMVAATADQSVKLAGITASNQRSNEAVVAEIRRLTDRMEMMMNKLPKNIRDSIVMVSG